jgi:hypothetical protein
MLLCPKCAKIAIKLKENANEKKYDFLKHPVQITFDVRVNKTVHPRKKRRRTKSFLQKKKAKYIFRLT